VRWNAFRQYSSGVVELALGNTVRGLNKLRTALAVFERLGYDWRAARCLLAEYNVTRETRLLAIAQEKLRHYAQSWLADELRDYVRSHQAVAARLDYGALPR
jgi:hypothetical protein